MFGKRHFTLRLLAGIALLSLGGTAGVAGQAGLAHAQTAKYLTVNTTADNAGDTCVGGHVCSLRGALDQANDNQGTTYNIYVPYGHYNTCDTLFIAGGAIVNLNGANQRGVIINADGENNGCDSYNHRGFVLYQDDSSSYPTVTMQNLTIEGAHVSGTKYAPQPYDGAGIAQGSGTLSLSNATITNNNTGDADGGGLYLDPTGADTLSNVTVSNNYAFNGGGIFLAGGSLTINGGTFLNNNACTNSYDASTHTTSCISNVITGGIVTDRLNPDFHTGGGIDIAQSASATITSATVRGNSAGNALCGGGSGGGIEGAGSLDLNRSTVSGNFAYFIAPDESPYYRSGRGGGVRINRTSSFAEIDNSTISANYAGNEGGGIFFGTTLTTRNDRIINNQAGGSPAGVTLTPSPTATIVTDCITGCGTAPSAVSGLGGGIAADHDMLDVVLYNLTDTASYISGNKAVDADNTYNGAECSSVGGAIYIDYNATATLTGTHVISNAACDGGGSFQVAEESDVTTPSPQLTFNNAYVYQNKAGDDGGGMNVVNDLNCAGVYLVVYNTRVVDNTAGTDGGGAWVSNGGLQVSGYGGFSGNHPDNIAPPSALLCDE
ncbi:MAG: hypothetical protein ACRDFS_13790 [Chloroflexota bacterium]